MKKLLLILFGLLLITNNLNAETFISALKKASKYHLAQAKVIEKSLKTTKRKK